jgi:hypothetical protein
LHVSQSNLITVGNGLLVHRNSIHKRAVVAFEIQDSEFDNFVVHPLFEKAMATGNGRVVEADFVCRFSSDSDFVICKRERGSLKRPGDGDEVWVHGWRSISEVIARQSIVMVIGGRRFYRQGSKRSSA